MTLPPFGHLPLKKGKVFPAATRPTETYTLGTPWVKLQEVRDPLARREDGLGSYCQNVNAVKKDDLEERLISAR
jgi:hypothetical protein